MRSNDALLSSQATPCRQQLQPRLQLLPGRLAHAVEPGPAPRHRPRRYLHGAQHRVQGPRHLRREQHTACRHALRRPGGYGRRWSAGSATSSVIANLVGSLSNRTTLAEGVMQRAAKWLMVASAAIGLDASGWAEDLDAGKTEYLLNCAPCHGTDGKGNGALSTKLRTKPADLTTFAKKNNGVFPVSAVYEAIDGRNATGSHGTREMPIWGCRHTPSRISPTKNKRKVYKQPDRYKSHLDLSCDPEDVIGNRILSVIEYLRRIQEK